MKEDPRIDDYIAKAADFARPILTELRAMVRRALPDAEETIKWGMPHFMVGGKNVAGFAAFKAHCTLVIHGDEREGDAMGQFGRITAPDAIPDAALVTERLHAARDRVMAKGSATARRTPRQPKAEIPVPADFASALDAVPAARTHFEAFPPGARREYLEWITEAKQQVTRDRRIAQAAEWIAEGKKRNWKYEGC